MTSYGKLSVKPGDKDEATVVIIKNVVCTLIDELLPDNLDHPVQVIS